MKRNRIFKYPALLLALLLLVLPSCAKEEDEYTPETEITTHKITAVTRAPPVSYDYYIGNKSTKKYHLPTCGYLPDKENQIRLTSTSSAEDQGYIPCQRCCP